MKLSKTEVEPGETVWVSGEVRDCEEWATGVVVRVALDGVEVATAEPGGIAPVGSAAFNSSFTIPSAPI